ncbi:F-box only protein [Ooceraea biroi]|uniref:F-box only protein n=1 Tax=Ooceraea biroi TaxID=2015173 RepID=A0A026WF55_OOCBI|nr:F-box only protein [Ooceraea biroi]
MSNKLEYLEKYSVAPPPSRDYYGLKVLQNEIILHLWRISHGPHKAPIVHCAKFVEFDQETSLQDEKRRGFGEHLLQHVINIAEGNRNTLLTLPKSLIERISRYLKFKDIVKLASLSRIAYEVFNADSLWQLLFKRDKRVKITIEERKKNFRIQSSVNCASDAKVNKPLSRSTSGVSMPSSKTISTINIAVKERCEFSNTDLVTTSLPKATFDTGFHGTNENAASEKSFFQKKIPNSKLSMNEKNIKKENFTTSKVTNREIKGVFKHDKGIDNQQNKSEKCINKININRTSQASKTEPVVSKISSFSKNTVENVKSCSNIAHKSHGRIRSKIKTKSKNLATTKSEIFNTDKELFDNPFVVRDSDLDLADLIEASLKNIRSPRSIFDYDFSCMQQSDARRNDLKSRNGIQDIDRVKLLKPMRSSVITNYLSDKMTRTNEILEKLSEKSEPFSGTSCESLVNDKKVLSGGDNSDTVSFENEWDSATNFGNKFHSPRKIENIDDKLSIAKGPVKTSFLMKTYGSRGLASKKDVKSSEIVRKNRIESTKVVKNVERNQLIK